MKTNNMNINSIMKTYSKYICLFLMLLGMSASAWGSLTKTYVFTTKSWTATCDGKAANWTSGQDGAGFSNNGIQVTTTATGANGTSPVAFENISKIVVTYNTNASKGAGTLDVKVGDNTKKTNKWAYSTGTGTSALYTTTFNYATPESGSVTITANTTTNSIYIVQVAITYAPSPKIVSYDAHGGTLSPEDDIVEEDEGGAGVTLPEVTPSSAIIAAGWGFYGWAEASVGTETTTAPTIVGKAGDTYYPDDDIELHAVYAKGEYTKITNTSGIEAGVKYIIASEYSDDNYIMTNRVTTDEYGDWLEGVVAEESSADKYSAASVDAAWLCTFTISSGKYYIQNAAGNYIDTYYKTSQWYNHGYDASDKYTIAFSDGTCTFQNTYGSYPYLVLFTNGTFGPDDESYPMKLYKETTTPRYNSNPCGNIVSLSAGTETHAEITSFSETGVETCSSTDANRQVTVSVTAATGYELTSSARLTFTKSSGTATASYVSGPTGSGPNYTFVYQFTKDDSGAGTFSVTATAKQSAITFDKNGGEGGSDGTTATYDAAMTTIIPPTRTGYTFDGYWDAETSNNGSGNQYYKADGTSKKNWDKNTTSATTLYAKWNINSYTLSIAEVSNVSISSTSPSVAAGSSTSVNYGTTVTLSHGTPSDGRTWSGWNAYKTGDTGTPVAVNGSNQFTMPAYDVTVSANLYGDFVFSCAELTLTAKPATEGTPFFITSRAEQTVRSQDSILVVGNGLTPNTTLTYPGLPSKFAIKTRLGANLQTDVNGEINAVAYIFYTPDAGDTSDGLDKLTGITVSVGGAKPKTVNLTQSIIGRHLPADFVIAAKRDGKWYALPDTMTGTWNPKPVEIAVDDIDNPTIAYTATTNVYNLYGQVSETIGGQAGYLYSNGHTIKLGMKNNATYANYPLFGSAGTSTIGKGGIATSVTNNIGKQYWWVLTQTNTSIENAQDAKYSIKSANNTAPLILKENAGNPQWGFFTTGSVGPIRLIPASASSVVPLEAKIVAWGKNSAIIEANVPTVSADYIIGKLPGDIVSSKIALVETGTSVKGTGTRYNYTVNFGVGLDFSANEGKMLTLEWYDGESLVAVSNVTVPRIVASNTTLNSTNFTNKSVWNTEVHVLAGDTLTIDASGYSNKDVTIKELNIYPGAAVIINTDTLKVTNLVLRSGWSRIGETFYGMGSLYIKPESGNGSMKATNAYLDWYIDYDQYYPIAVPWKVATASISYQNMTVATSAGLKVRYYDGERHAKGGDGDTNWKEYTWGGTMPTNLVPGIGYAITARRPAGKAFSIIRMPLTIPSADWTKNGEQGVVSDVHKDQVSVTAWVKDEGETPDHAKGWNFIANPYMCNYKGDITHSESDGEHDYDIGYVNIPDVNFKEFDQVEIGKATLKPGSGFLIQTEKTGKLTFGTTNRKASAPSYRTATPKATKQKAYIILSGEEAEDEMGLIISERYTAEYEINADLEKLLSDGNTLRTFMRYGELNMAYVAINEELAREWIPVNVRLPEAGEYTFSLHEASKISELEGIYLIDYESNTVTNLIEDNYSFVAAGGTIADRFAINAIVGKHNTPTDIDIINAGGDINSKKPVKFIWDDKVFILHNGVIYDSTGKRVREINR